jgi:hypothetical protein
MSFKSDIENALSKVRSNIKEVEHNSINELTKRIMIATPVGIDGEFGRDYVGGHLKKNWQVGVNSIPQGEIDGEDKTGFETFSKNKSIVNSSGLGNIYYIVNNAPYASVVEFGLYEPPNSKNVSGGYSKKAPDGMVGITVLDWQYIVSSQINLLK